MTDASAPSDPSQPRDPRGRLEELRHQQDRGKSVKLAPFWGHTAHARDVGPWVLSQWWPAAFSVDDVTYPHAEAFMMASKARLFGDEAALAKIVAGTTPKQAKAVGRTVRGFDPDVWTANAYRLVVAGNLAKFSQHRDLLTFLASTAPAVLVEASPFDRIWGIGLGPDHPHVADVSRWRGQNLLGFALTEVRERLTS